ncbi:fimbrial protein [Proteus mirabilis]|uniref:fimbrial protein n=1 Tax=Proteus mirabilis TaxID=584 RepID=UPI0018C7D3AE|nr:fimbrial protein [Proteus mirabilis]MBG3038590.1 type 1 fimbrial protein [Proteus mirabilis]MBG6018402.1 type 1 fimbrial protein [Proteus mirabilis]MBU9978658.1 type 1 fimbrial protein [Proteus mirabilis]MDX4950196.1 fimbrial protein [Proteus mirabilis]HDT0722072.1 type 1 fimbrial protein [Proteus mirabilis]
MKLKKLHLVLGLGLSIIAGAALAADQGHGTVEFYGSIIDAPCSIDPDSGAQRIPLGQVSSSALKDGGRSASKMFKIKLLQCSTETYKTVKTTFTGAEAPDVLEGALGIEGIAKNAAVVITNAGGEQIKLGQASAAQTLNDGNNDLNFAAYLQGSSSKAAIPGDFTAIATFALSYQ